eukprot:scaffold169608_cov39-Attheya_sp.AAC.1
MPASSQSLTRFPAEGNRVDSFIQKVEDIFNKQISGTDADPGQFVSPTETPEGGRKADTQIAIICMANDRTLIDLCVPAAGGGGGGRTDEKENALGAMHS